MAEVIGPSRVLIFSADGQQAAVWGKELLSIDIRASVARNSTEALEGLAQWKCDLAILSGDVLSQYVNTTDTWLFHAPRPMIIWVASELSALTVIELYKQGDWVLPSPLEPLALSRALQVLSEPTDGLAEFARCYRLSPRETALLRHALAGLNNDEAAEALGCSRPTISSFWNRIFRKTQATGQRDVIIRLLQTSTRRSAGNTLPLRIKDIDTSSSQSRS
jgi:DNA-binding CsgD family transcriptional regulator